MNKNQQSQTKTLLEAWQGLRRGLDSERSSSLSFYSLLVNLP